MVTETSDLLFGVLVLLHALAAGALGQRIFQRNSFPAISSSEDVSTLMVTFEIA